MAHRVLVVISFCCLGALADNNSPTEPYGLRLEGGASRCQGEVQLQRAGQKWTGVHPFGFTLEFGTRVCAELGCESAQAVSVEIGPDRELLLVVFDCEETSLIRCFQKRTSSTQAVKLKCSDSVRLSSGPSLCSGSLQIHWDQSWTSVCEGALDLQDAEVVCRELGCGAPSLLQGVLLGKDQAPLQQMFHCEGHESGLMDCPRNKSGNCSPGAVHLTCSEPVMLMGGASRCAGMVMRQSGEWRPISSQFSPWHLAATAGVCRDMDCGSPVSGETTYFLKTSVWEARPQCVERAAVSECVWDGQQSDSGVEAVCLDSVRLSSGPSLCSGSLQIHWDQSWTSVCEGALDRQDAEVVCKELGCGAPSLLQGVLLGKDQAPLQQMFHCEGHESGLMDCPRNKSGSCSPGAVHLTCSEPVQLVGGASRCAGTAEVKHKGEWRRIEPCMLWDLEATTGVCQALGCGSAVSGEKTESFLKSPVWTISGPCVKRRGALRDCVLRYNRDTKARSLKVVCSDSLNQPIISLFASDGVSEAHPQGLRVLLGSPFSVRCSVEPQYPGGTFQLLSPSVDPAQNHTLPAVNHSALFLFSDAGFAHKGGYTCIYHQHAFNHSFSSQSHTLQLYLGVPASQIIIRAVILLLLKLLYLIPNLYYYCKATRGHQKRQRRSP